MGWIGRLYGWVGRVGRLAGCVRWVRWVGGQVDGRVRLVGGRVDGWGVRWIGAPSIGFR
jgi:hypothetical protein